MAARAEEFARGLATGGTLFEELGFYYIGPLDGHNLDHLIPVLENVRDARRPRAGADPRRDPEGQGLRRRPRPPTDKYHGVNKFDVDHRRAAEGEVERALLHLGVRQGAGQGGRRSTTGSSRSTPPCRPAPGSTCSRKAFPERCFDVGIAEQHAVTFAAGLATEGFRPFCAIYSTFLQRAYDQVVHDVAIQSLPVRFAHRPRRPGRRRRRHPRRLASTSPISAACPAS